MRASSLLASFLLAVLLGGCATRGTTSAVDPIAGKGKVHVRYVATAAESSKAPAAFNVYRSSRRDGPFEKINKQPLPPPRDPGKGTVVPLYTDVGLPLGTVYYYYLEAVDAKGGARKVTPVTAAAVVLPLQPEDRAALAAKQATAIKRARAGTRDDS